MENEKSSTTRNYLQSTNYILLLIILDLNLGKFMKPAILNSVRIEGSILDLMS
jgi:hypothetical protein